MMMKPDVWAPLVGQQAAVTTLARAALAAHAVRAGGSVGSEMTHAWLIVGPPGSGRSRAAIAFAAALMCPDEGCGECRVCRSVAEGLHPDVHVEATEGSKLLLENVRPLVHMAALSPVQADWRVIIVEDADRLRDESANFLLKALEEPTRHTVWVLCAPSAADVLPTIASRTRQVALRTPPAAEVAQMLQDEHGVDPLVAAYAARASQGHIGRARALAFDPGMRERRQRFLNAPMDLRDLASCLTAAEEVIDAAEEVAAAKADVADEAEQESLRARFYVEGQTRLSGAVKRAHDAEVRQISTRAKRRRKRMVVDEIDGALIDLIGLFRDVIAVQFAAETELINEEMRTQIERIARSTTSAQTIRRLDALTHARRVLMAEGTPRTVMEAAMIRLKDPDIVAVG